MGKDNCTQRPTLSPGSLPRPPLCRTFRSSRGETETRRGWDMGGPTCRPSWCKCLPSLGALPWNELPQSWTDTTAHLSGVLLVPRNDTWLPSQPDHVEGPSWLARPQVALGPSTARPPPAPSAQPCRPRASQPLAFSPNAHCNTPTSGSVPTCLLKCIQLTHLDVLMSCRNRRSLSCNLGRRLP